MMSSISFEYFNKLPCFSFRNASADDVVGALVGTPRALGVRLDIVNHNSKNFLASCVNISKTESCLQKTSYNVCELTYTITRFKS